MTIRNTPTSEAMASAGENNAAIVPSRAVSANVRAPRSLLDPSLSIPTSRPTPRDVAIFAATSAGGNRATTIDMFKQKVYTVAQSQRAPRLAHGGRTRYRECPQVRQARSGGREVLEAMGPDYGSNPKTATLFGVPT